MKNSEINQWVLKMGKDELESHDDDHGKPDPSINAVSNAVALSLRA